MLKLQRAGRIGFVGTSTGLEASRWGGRGPASERLDVVRSARGGAALVRGLPLSEYVAQMYCNSNDTAKGRQMCNHFQHKGSNYPNGRRSSGPRSPTGGARTPAAARRRGAPIHMGDGATNSNGFHRLNFAGVWKVPRSSCVDNGWAISVCSRDQTAAESYAAKAEAYGMPGSRWMATTCSRFARPPRRSRARAPARGRASWSSRPTACRTLQRRPHQVPRGRGGRALAGALPARALRGVPGGAGCSAQARRRPSSSASWPRSTRSSTSRRADPMPLRSLVEDVYEEVPRSVPAVQRLPRGRRAPR